MAKVLITEDYLQDIADAIREKNNSSNTYTPSEMATAISNLPDLSVTTATAGDVKRGKKFLLSDGTETDGTYDYTWMGDHATLINSNFYNVEIALKDTEYASWTPGTSATAIVATSALSDKQFTADVANYEYMIEWLWCCDAAYPTGQTYKLCMDRTYGAAYQIVHRRPYGLANFADKNFAYNYCTTLYTASGYNIYWKSDGTHSWTTTMYGFYVSGLNAATLSSTDADSITVTPKTPTVSARCHSSYFSTTRAGQVDQENSTIKIVGNIYRVDAGTCALRNMYGKAVDLYSNPL